MTAMFMKTKAQEEKDVLLVEDCETDAYHIKRCLARSDGIKFNIHHIETMNDALRALGGRKFDAVLLDMNLSDSERLDTIARISKVTDAAIVVLTSHTDEDLALKAINAGVQDFLGKDNIDSRKLKKAIHFALERQKTRSRLSCPADRDGLTGLPNRQAFIDRCEDFIRVADNNKRMALHLIDIKNIKDIITEYGLPTGEAVLKSVASRLYGIFQSDKIFARLEGETFGLFQLDVAHDGHALYTARRVFESLDEPLEIAGHKVHAEASTGIAFYPDHGRDWDILYQHAAIALDRARYQGSSSCQLYGRG